MANKKVLVLGAGIMASHMVPYLADQGYDVDVFTLLDTVSDRPNVKYFKQDAKDPATRRQYLANNFHNVAGGKKPFDKFQKFHFYILKICSLIVII